LQFFLIATPQKRMEDPMPLDQSYISENAAAREQLAALANRLSDQQLGHPLEAGWTVSAALAHLAFWDQRALLLIEKWKKEGVGPSPIDVDIVNEVVRGLCLAIPPRAAADLALSAATAIDQAIEHLSPEMVKDLETIGTTVRLDRARHRRLHLDQIKTALGIEAG
jgi:hypothetical protein